MALSISGLSGPDTSTASDSEILAVANSKLSVIEKAQLAAQAGVSISRYAKATGVSENDIKAALLQAGVAQGEPAANAGAATQPTPATPTPNTEAANAANNSPTSGSSSNFKPWTGGKPQHVKEAMDYLNGERNLGYTFGQVSNLLYGMGVNDDFRNFLEIMNAPDPISANDQAVGNMWDDPDYRHPKTHKKQSKASDIEFGNLGISFDENQVPTLWAQSANNGSVVRIGSFGRGGSLPKDGALARYGITVNDISAAMADSRLAGSTGMLDYLSSQTQKAYDPAQGGKYTVTDGKAFFTQNGETESSGGGGWTGSTSINKPLDTFKTPFNRPVTPAEAAQMNAGMVWARVWDFRDDTGRGPQIRLVNPREEGYITVDEYGVSRGIKGNGNTSPDGSIGYTELIFGDNPAPF